jgi:hypothetical protein
VNRAGEEVREIISRNLPRRVDALYLSENGARRIEGDEGTVGSPQEAAITTGASVQVGTRDGSCRVDAHRVGLWTRNRCGGRGTRRIEDGEDTAKGSGVG